MAKRKTRRILVSIPTAAHTQRLKLEGILRYVREKRGDAWRLQLDLGGFARQRLKDFASWKCDGIIAYIDSPAKLAFFRDTGLPSVLINPLLSPNDPSADDEKTVVFVNDHAREGRTAARHFLERRFEHFAYVGTPERTPWSDRRGEGFAAELAAHGRTCIAYPPISAAAREDFAREMPGLVKWLAALPRPTAVFAAHDIRARQVLAAADAAGLDVPERLAVLGVDDDEPVCETAAPPLSSIPTNDVSLGYACGRALEELIAGRGAGRTISTAHVRVVGRASTDITAVDDPFVARALSWARNHLADDLDIDTLAAKTGYSARYLQMRAQRALGTTIGDEIRRMRLAAAAELLSGTDRPISLIADECGFSSVSHLSDRFVKAYRLTPREFRNRGREG